MIQVEVHETGCDARGADFAEFNEDVPHVCVEIPNGWSTISARLPSGQCVTFAFVPYEENGEPQCVDVKYHGGEQFEPSRPDWHRQSVIVFAGGGTDYHTDTSNQIATFTTVMFK